MDISDNQLLRLTNQICGHAKVVIKYKFNYRDEEYLCVKRISYSETSELGPYYFMRIQGDNNGQIVCECVKEASLIYELMTEVANLLSVENRPMAERSIMCIERDY